MTDKIEKKESSELTTESDQLVGVDNIESLIKIIRGQQVMLDRDLATLYGVETKRLNPSLTLWGNFHKFLVIFSS